MRNKNTFKAAIAKGEVQIGLWLSTTSPYMAEIAATAGYDWLLIDGEHAPNTAQTLFGQLQAVAPYESHPVVRPLEGGTALIKQVLDIGAQSILVPMIDTPAQAEATVAALRYPPAGKRGVGASIARASRWGRIPNYMEEAEKDLCLLVQCESREGLANLERIAQVDGIDGVFFGPADLSTDMGFLGDGTRPEVLEAMQKGIEIVRRHGKAAGTLAVNPDIARKFIDWGASFVAVAVDSMLYVDALDAALAPFKK